MPMMDVTVNIPEVVAEVRALFQRYEQALIDKNVEVLDATFWDSPHAIRYAFRENGYGFAQIHAHRVARPPGPGTKEKRIRLEILTLGRDLATVNLEFKVRGQDAIGRQSQTWVRFPNLGNQRLRAYLEASGFEVLNVEGEPKAAASGNQGINDHDPEEVVAFASRVCRPDADALLCSCTAWRSVEAVAELERRTGKPVVTSNQASIWASFRALGLRSALKGFGRLLQDLAA
jgi:hypothetical protein